MRRISSARRRRFAFPLGAGIASIGILILVLVRLIFPSASLAVEAPLLSLSAPLTSSVGSFFAGFKNSATLSAKLDALGEKNAELAAENAALAAKVADLTALIGTAPVVAPGIAASVISRPPLSPYDTLVVAAGSDDGVEQGDLVYAPGGIPFGVVEGVSGRAARITLLSASGMNSQAWVGAAHTPVTLSGQGGGSFSAAAPQSASSTGAEVYLAGGSAAPIGSVASAGGDPAAPFATLSIKGLVNPFSITSVLIRPAASAAWPLAASSTAP